MSEQWRKHAACRDIDPAVFYPPTEDEAGVGLRICASCPVWEECLNFAVTHREKEGTWGGQSQWERKRIFRRTANQRIKQRKEQGAEKVV